MHSYKSRVRGKVRVCVLLSAVLLPCFRAEAQFGTQFSSGSTGVDGALNITAPGVTYFDPKALNLTKNTNIFNFTTITIAAGSTLKFWEGVFHGPVFLLASGDVSINGGLLDITGDASPGPTASGVEQGISFAGSGGYSGGLGGIHGDPNHAALPGNGPGGGVAGDVNQPFANGGQFSGNQFLVPLVGGSGGGGTNENSGQFGSQGGAGGGAILIASSSMIQVQGGDTIGIRASGGSGGSRGCGGAGGSVRLVANSIALGCCHTILASGGGGGACRGSAGPGLVRLEGNSVSGAYYVDSGVVTSLPFSLNLSTAPLPVISVTSINGIPVNANPFSFPDATINTVSPVPVVITATNVPIASTVNMYLLSDTGPNQTIPVKLTGTDQASTATVNVAFPSIGTRGFVKAVFQ